MTLAPLFSSVGMMAVIIGIGAMIGRMKPVTAEARQLLITIVINVAVPCIILNGIFHTQMNQQLLHHIFLIFFIAVGLSCLGMLLAFLFAVLCKVPINKRKEFSFIAGLGNTGFIGLPLCVGLFGPTGGLLAAVYDAGLDLILWTIGVMVLKGKKECTWKNMRSIVNIPMLAIVVGMFLALMEWQPPEMVKSLTAMLSSIAAPLAMLYIGLLIPDLLIRKQQTAQALPILSLSMIVKLFLYPVIVAGLLWSFHLATEISQVTLVMAAMPTMTLASMLFAKYAADEDLGAMATVSSTIISFVTIPLVVMLGQFILSVSLF
ncbi:AEC family transporter [Brevibacillus sp. SKDU10]|uniref:AEC family transporter n=1 Tax=Brevibacillus sp. SKDU10 TaxID=1247872 RepID=UPI000AACE790|nr:AEC family transporter [Brevibacillus sp. SKDU10]